MPYFLFLTQKSHFLQRLEKDCDIKAQPKKVTAENSASERQQIYLNGGVLFITTRILVVEMLTERIPMSKNFQNPNLKQTFNNFRLYRGLIRNSNPRV